MSELFGILALTIVAPIWIVSHYVTKWRLAKGLSNDEAQTLEELWQIAQGMEQYVTSPRFDLDQEFRDL